MDADVPCRRAKRPIRLLAARRRGGSRRTKRRSRRDRDPRRDCRQPAQHRSRQPRARMPCRSVFISKRRAKAAGRPARRRPCHRQPRRVGPLPVELLRRAVPAQPVQLRPRPLAALRSPRASREWQNAVAIAKIVDQELHPSPVGKALFFHARRVSPGWRLTRVGDARQPRLLPLMSFLPKCRLC